MRHQVAGKKLGRDFDHRRALRNNLMVSLILHEKIKTTEAKADSIRAEVEKLVTKAKRGLAHPDPARAVHARRIVLARLRNNRDAMEKIFNELAPRFADRPGGYTRTAKLGPRKGDAAMIVMIEFIPAEAEEEA